MAVKKSKQKKKNPIDKVFGIWKNKKLSLKKLRKKAWGRKKSKTKADKLKTT